MKKTRKIFGMNLTLLSATLLLVSVLSAYSQIQPDLVISRVSFSKDRSGLFVNKVSVLVTNACSNSTATTSYVLLTFKGSAEPDAKAIYYIGNTVKALKGGESYVQTFDVLEKKIGVSRHIYAEVDPYKKVIEASEDNNWYTVNPYRTAVRLTQAQCSAKM